jgi:hypothetical protein
MVAVIRAVVASYQGMHVDVAAPGSVTDGRHRIQEIGALSATAAAVHALVSIPAVLHHQVAVLVIDEDYAALRVLPVQGYRLHVGLPYQVDL